MGCLFSSDAEAASSAPLLDGAASGAAPRFTKEVSASASAAAAAAAAGPAKKVPSFVKRAQQGAAAAAAAPARQTGVGLFCACGGPGSLVELLPCGHHALCLHCAQFKRACPVCAAAIADSKPSFRAPPRAAASE